jgi:hypothetical protein
MSQELTQELTTEQLITEDPAEGAAPVAAGSTEPTSKPGEDKPEQPAEG